ncbi:LysR family transcriptional regulator [Leucobacter sp.]
MPTPSIAELQCLESAVRTGSLSAAARDLGVSQQAVSSRMRGLERTIGVELLHRSFSGIAPTAAGEAVLARAREVLAAIGRLDEAISDLRDASAEAISVGGSQTVASHLLPGWLLGLRRAQLEAGRPATAVHLRTANSDSVIAMVRSGALDLGFIETPEAPRDLGTTVVRRDRMVLAVATDHPWAARAAVRLPEAAEVPLVAREPGSGTRAAFEAAVLAELGREPVAPLVVLATEAAVRSAVIDGVAPAVLSELTVRDDVRLGRLRALDFEPRPVHRPLMAIWRGSQRDLTGAPRELVAIAARR